MKDQARRYRHTFGDLVNDAFYIGIIGGGLVAVFFLLYDVLTRGQPLFTPSLMGSVLFNRVPASSVDSVDMMAVAKFSALHLLAFGLLGLGIAYVTHQAEIRSRHPVVVVLVVFVILEVAFWVGSAVAIPGVLRRLGVMPVAAANLLAAAGVALFLVSTHRAHKTTDRAE